MFISDIWTKYPDWLESNHKFIQWLFPLQESSKFNHGAPVLTNEDVTYLRDNKSFQDSLNCSFWMMMQFYGIDYDDTSDQFIVTNLLRARNTWLTSFNHNQLRMTRILNCLDLFGRADLSFKLRVLLKEMHQKYNVINDDTIQYWKLDNLED